MEDIKRIAEEIFDEIRGLRRTLHQHPELAFCEHETSELICSYLDKLQVPYQKNVAKTGVVGLIQVGNNAKTLLMRADMDALPIQEGGCLPFKSKNDGIMHACGHDGHMAILLGTAAILSRLRDRLCCNTKLVFQPAEETAGGALPMIEEGVLENPKVDAAVGGHIMNNVDVGKILIKHGEMMAAPDDFDLVVHGKGGHGASPHNCVDPIAVAMQILSAWNTLSARFTTPLEKHLISVNMFKAGNCHNVIPDDAHIKGTVRVFDDSLRRILPEKMEHIAKHIAEAFGATYEFCYHFRYPPLINDLNMTDAFGRSAAAIIGAENVVVGKEPSMIGEDFAYFAERVPATFINFGSKNEALGSVMPLHSSDFTIDENCLKIGMLVMSQFAFDFGR